jgi:hypothetical protein
MLLVAYPHGVLTLAQPPFDGLAPAVRHTPLPAPHFPALAYGLHTLAVPHFQPFEHGLARKTNRQHNNDNSECGVYRCEKSSSDRVWFNIAESWCAGYK